MIDKLSPPNLLAAVVLVCSLVGTVYLSLDKIESHESRIVRMEDELAAFRVEYARNEAEEDSADAMLNLRIQYLMKQMR